MATFFLYGRFGGSVIKRTINIEFGVASMTQNHKRRKDNGKSEHEYYP
nr:MAG TPA: hypothetical protein [Caudoviricetes sp.]